MENIKTIIARFSEISRLEIETIIAHVLRISREAVLISPDRQLAPRQIGRIEKLIARRQSGEPLAYLTGHKEFYGLDFTVNRHVLVPRPETELMIDEVLALVEKDKPDAIIDVGTGSGCIAITLAKRLGSRIIAIDISKRALATARKNAELNGVDGHLEFIHGNLLRPLLETGRLSRDARLVICANLPYLTPAQIAASPSIRHEPYLALESGTDGLRHYRKLFKQIKDAGLSDFVILCEIDDTQGAAMRDLIATELPQTRFEIKQDLGHYDRLAIIHSN